MGISFLRPFLQTLCCNSPWSYAVFWKLKHQNEMVLAWEDGLCDILKPRDATSSPVEDFYFENSNVISSSTLTPSLVDGTHGSYLVGCAIAEMSRASHVMGKGVVGEAALKRNARWIYSDSIETDVLNSILVSKYPDEWLLQFAAGIKTILLLPVIPDGVLQLGSMEVVAEDAALVAYVKNKFETHKGSDGYIQHLSLMSAFLDNFEEPLTVTAENLIEDQYSIDAFSTQDHYSISNQMNHVSEPSQLSYADYEGDILKFYYEEKLMASPHCYELNTRMCGDFVNELLDFHFEEGVITEPAFVGNGFDNAICGGESDLFNFNEAYELDKALDSVLHDKTYEQTSTVDVFGVEPAVNELENHLVGTDFPNGFDDDSSEKSTVTSINISSCSFPKSRFQPKHIAEQLDNFSASVSSVESKISSVSEPRKRHASLKKLSRLSTTSKKRARSGDNQRPRPRDRQLIQDRIKELRELVPSSEKSSIDGLLDKTIKHMLFLKSVTNQADKLRHPFLREEVDENTTKLAEVNYKNQDGTSWAVELGSQHHFCPIVVKDLDHPGHMIIQVVCNDHDLFLEITDVIHRLKLTILKGVMEKTSDKSSWARFIVQTCGNFHRLDIFWPLMQLLQKDGARVSTNN